MKIYDQLQGSGLAAGNATRLNAGLLLSDSEHDYISLCNNLLNITNEDD